MVLLIHVVICRKASFRPSSSGCGGGSEGGELTDVMTDEVTDEANSDSFMQPLYRLIFELFELTGIFKWLPRTLVSLVQVAYGKSISRYCFSVRLPLPCL